jgi:hypothetical protein
MSIVCRIRASIRRDPVPTSSPHRSRAYLAWIPLIGAAALLTACSKNNPTAPQTYTLSGRVRLVSALRDEAGDSTDAQRVENADSVRVYLYQGSVLKDSTRTAAGGYRFSGLGSGSYSAVTLLWGGIGDTVSVANLTSDAALDTLVLQSSPTMIAFPNPLSTTTAIRYPLSANSPVLMIAMKPSGLKVRNMIQQNLPAGYFQYLWDGTDGAANPLPAGPYWILFQAGSDYRARLVVKS